MERDCLSPSPSSELEPSLFVLPAMKTLFSADPGSSCWEGATAVEDGLGSFSPPSRRAEGSADLGWGLGWAFGGRASSGHSRVVAPMERQDRVDMPALKAFKSLPLGGLCMLAQVVESSDAVSLRPPQPVGTET